MISLCKKLFMGAIGVCMLVSASGAAVPEKAEAADLYTVLYANISQYNGDAVQCDWIANAILYASSTYQVDPLLIASIMQTESGYHIDSLSPVGAIGLMQLMPGTAASIGVNPYDPLDNVIGGTIYIANQLNNFQNWGLYGVTDAVAAYNAGPQAVYDYGGVPPYRETQNYVVSVNNAYNNLLNLCNYY